jgi:hypothetical protein
MSMQTIEPGWTGARLLAGLQEMAGQRAAPFTAGDLCRVQVAVNGGTHFLPGRIIASYPAAFQTRTYDVRLLGSGTILRNVKEISLRQAFGVVPGGVR